MQTSEQLTTIGKCQINLLGQIHENWPCYGRCGKWVLSAYAYSLLFPKEMIDVLTVTHEPTGLRACYVPNTTEALRILARFNKLFGSSKTLDGVMRKWDSLPKREKNWVRSMRLPEPVA